MFNKYNFQIYKIASKTQARPEITGVFVEPSHTVATDSFRLLEVEAVKDEQNINFKPFIITAESSKAMTTLINSPEMKDKFKDISKIEGEYPKYKEIMQEKGKYIRFSLEINKPIFFNGENKDTKQKSRGAIMPIMSQ